MQLVLLKFPKPVSMNVRTSQPPVAGRTRYSGAVLIAGGYWCR
jgi:hypothetical protein